MIKKIVVLCFIVLIGFSSKVFAANEKIPSAAFSVGMGVTDDANKFTKMLRTDVNGYLKTTLGTALSHTTDSMSIYPPDPSMYHIATASSFQIKSGSGYLFSIIVNTGGAGSATVYDNTACSTTTVAVVNTAAQVNLTFNGKFATGLCVTTTGTADITVIWK